MSLLRQLLTSPPMSAGIGFDAFRRSHEIEGSAAGAQTDYQVKITVHYADPDITSVSINHYGTVLQPSGVGSESVHLATGPVVEKDGTLYMVYGGASSGAPPDWTPHLATSSDGITWAKQGQLFTPPSGYDRIYPSSILLEGGVYYLFIHMALDDPDPDDPADFEIWYATSTDLTNWTIQSKVRDAVELGIDKPITNPSVIKVGAYYYMVVSKRVAAGKYDIRLLKSSSRTSGYSQLGVIIDPDAAEYTWYDDGAWDASIFEYYGKYVLVFGGKEGASHKHYAFAYATDIEGAWTVIDPPFYSDSIMGRIKVYFDGELLKIYGDRNPGGVEIDLFYDVLIPDYITLNEKCRTDFGDIRFRQGVTELDYWMEKKVDSSYAIFWVKVPTIPADPDSATIHIYYGKAGVTTTTSSIYDTFPVGDDFEECDLARWVDEDVAPGVSTCETDQKFEGSYSYRGEDGAAGGGLARISQVIAERTKLKVWGALRVPTPPGGETASAMVVLFNNGTRRLMWTNGNGDLRYYDGSAWQTVYAGSVNTWYQFLLIFKDTTAEIFFYNAAGAVLGSEVIKTMDSTGSITKLLLQISYTTGGAGYAWQDIIRLGEYCDPEPTHGAWGSEEAVVWPF